MLSSQELVWLIFAKSQWEQPDDSLKKSLSDDCPLFRNEFSCVAKNHFCLRNPPWQSQSAGCSVEVHRGLSSKCSGKNDESLATLKLTFTFSWLLAMNSSSFVNQTRLLCWDHFVITTWKPTHDVCKHQWSKVGQLQHPNLPEHPHAGLIRLWLFSVWDQLLLALMLTSGEEHHLREWRTTIRDAGLHKNNGYVLRTVAHNWNTFRSGLFDTSCRCKQSHKKLHNWHADSSHRSIVHLSRERTTPRDLEPNLSQMLHSF